MKTQQTCSPLNRKEFYDTVFIVHRVFLKMSQFSAKYLSDFFFFFFFFIHVSLPNELEHTTSKYGGDLILTQQCFNVSLLSGNDELK